MSKYFAIAIAVLVLAASSHCSGRSVRGMMAGIPKAPAQPSGNLTLVADGFTWAENLWFDGAGGLFVTDDMAGIIYKLVRPSGTGKATKTPWISGFSFCLGLYSVFNRQHQMYAVVKFNPKAGQPLCNGSSYGIIRFDTRTPNTYVQAACTEQIGNGLAVNTANGRGTIYTASEGNFIPGRGLVYDIDVQVAPARVATLADKLTAADGAFLDQRTQLLYVSEVLTAEILVFNVSARPIALVARYKAPGCKMVDDMCIAYVSPTTARPSARPFLYAADFWAGSVVAFAADGSGAGTVLATGLQQPTSVRQGRGQGWNNPRSLFITEGGGLLPAWQKDRRVWELHL